MSVPQGWGDEAELFGTSPRRKRPRPRGSLAVPWRELTGALAPLVPIAAVVVAQGLGTVRSLPVPALVLGLLGIVWAGAWAARRGGVMAALAWTVVVTGACVLAVEPLALVVAACIGLLVRGRRSR